MREIEKKKKKKASIQPKNSWGWDSVAGSSVGRQGEKKRGVRVKGNICTHYFINNH